jgi:hypothetical protein
MAEKSLVNDAAEILGVAPPEAAAEDEELVVVLELDDELPQPAITTAAANAGTRPHFPTDINISPLNARAPDSAP